MCLRPLGLYCSACLGVKDLYYAKMKDNIKNLFCGRQVLLLMSWDHDVFGKTTGVSRNAKVCLFLARQPPSGPGPPHS